ncbi:MAG: bifunctional folylpolyglutamate synthase/dihydrofolate synthase [Chloroflexota bacterium]
MSTGAGLRYLRTFPDFEQGNVTPETAFTLDRVLSLLDEVGAPQLRLPVIHIAGTKGKGSTAAMIASIARAAGYSTALFTQPHLVDIRERFQIDGESIDDDALDQIMLHTIHPAVERLRVRGMSGVQQFEAQVALAFLWFEARRAKVVVLETGLGGRLDGTNVVPEPVCVALTPIGYDHMAILGNTLEEIAGEKAAIIKRRVPAVTAPQEAAPARVFERVARKLEAPLWRAGREWEADVEEVSLRGTRFTLAVDWDQAWATGASVGSTWRAAAPSGRFRDLFTPLLGAHQGTNAGTAAMTAMAASVRLPRLTPDAVRQGLATVSWPGRLQIIAEGPTVVLDGAHTAESARALASAMCTLFGGARLVLVIGMQLDKDIPATVAPLVAGASAAVATRSPHPRAAGSAVVGAALRAAGCGLVEERDGPLEALERARAMAGEKGVVLVTGSLHLVGAILAARVEERAKS